MSERPDKRARVILVSELERFMLGDAQGRRAKPSDLSVNLTDGDHPPIRLVLFKNEKGVEVALPSEAIKRIDCARRWFEVDDLTAATPVSNELLDGQALLRRDVLDSLVLDLKDRSAMRANDLWLEENGGELSLAAADGSGQAILRRLTRGWIDRRSQRALRDWKYVEFLSGDPERVRDGSGEHLRIARLPAGEIARLIEAMPYLHAAALLKMLPAHLAADVLEMMTSKRELQVFEELDEERALQMLALMAPDAAADLIGHLHVDASKRYLEALSEPQRDRLIELLRYPEDTVGGVMTNDVIFAPARLTKKEARESLRERLKQADFTYFLYVVDDEESRKLQGVITLRELIIAEDGQRLEDLMNPYVTTLDPLEPARIAADRVLSSHLAALPVVGDQGRLIGIMTVDAAVAEAAPQSWSTRVPKIFS
jgi:magnesium transporter